MAYREIRILVASSVPNYEVPLMAADIEDFVDDTYPEGWLLLSAGPVGDDAPEWYDPAQEQMNDMIDEDEMKGQI